ncbi:MAG: hypothetical protein HN742_36055 [Lentisphaerae bacterium]|jgi:hypothetical protein|nr:hypothetical protein [Lentisphaerota bacterium]MBT4816378.1 hypothetical protein [Lentisphaerota bacterium]MBT5606668.1 hypothetical protein [Lentisphaerota bacterium]MBT7059817.1 hypothetical protein [Lentisphaerota bacterium]MBT7847340.1 hypothetical protein [Lentisphaerota bacterium]
MDTTNCTCSGHLWACAVSGLLFSSISVAEAAEPAELKPVGPWRIAVSVRGGPAALKATLDVPPPDTVTVRDEKHKTLREFNPKRAGWTKGNPLTGVRACECTVKGALDPSSLAVRHGTGPETIQFEKGKDFDVDPHWATVGRLPEGRIKADQPVFISYRYAKRRLDAVVLTEDGKILLVRGEPEVAMCRPPELPAGATHLANIFISGMIPALTADNLFPILETAYPEPLKSVPSIAEARLPETMKKLRSGEPLTILAWGDSVTTFKRWQTMFVKRLQAKYPQAKINLVTEAWGGRNSGSYLAEPPGSPHNYKEKILARKPDLIVSEFVNDAGLNPARVEKRYGKLLGDFKAIGAEWIILTPHYVIPSWMGLKSQRNVDQDPRPYVKGLRQFTETHQVALADASLRYGRLWRQGIPYLTLMENNINHPNVFGHSLFADSLIALFP